MNLTDKQEKFVQELIKGCSQRAAYKNSYNVKTLSDKNIDSKASTLFSLVKVKARYNSILDKSSSKSIVTREELLTVLKSALMMSVGLEPTPTAEISYNAIQDSWSEHQTKLKRADLKALSGIADRISKLQGYDKTEEKKQEPIQIILKKAECKECELENEES